MILTQQQTERLLPVKIDRQRLGTLISNLKENIATLQQDEKEYYNAEQDQQEKEQYYQSIMLDKPNRNTIESLQQLLQETHTNQVRYDPSEYVYPWVDLKPDGNLTSIYSGKNRKPEEIIQEDYVTSLKRQSSMDTMFNSNKNLIDAQLTQIEKEFPYNCEHVVPQSWFNEEEPMRGDIHHLFTCEPKCNSFRSNYPYFDFVEYQPEEITSNRVRTACGKAEDRLFEPEYGKGAVARAMLYFLLRYPDDIENQYLEKIDVDLLLDWHQKFPPDLYEKHRNQAIFKIQGNRNPFIDFPEEMREIVYGMLLSGQ
ncbi:endonuclease I family protein [Oceanobacillus rekensis]|uniref:endonuclease I family protein n=1 Tax=Oceanobacillus rekensis TaxID=937927 RepID=UPI000B4371E3|nr:endonuclease [Oceanobacillus rekensis]